MDVGSSRISRSGSSTMARAMATRCRSPPLRDVYKRQAIGRTAGTVITGVRPQHIFLQHGGIAGKVEVSEMMGSEQHLHLNIGGTEVVAVVPTMGTGSRADQIEVLFHEEHIHFFDPQTEERIL